MRVMVILYVFIIRYLNKWWAKYCWLKIYLLLTCRVSSFHYSMGSGTTETWSRHFVREPKGSPPSAVPFRGPKRIWDIKYGYSTFRNRLRIYVHTKRYFRTGGNRINMEGNDESTLVEFIKIKNSRKNNNFLLCCCVRDTKRRKIDDKFWEGRPGPSDGRNLTQTKRHTWNKHCKYLRR